MNRLVIETEEDWNKFREIVRASLQREIASARASKAEEDRRSRNRFPGYTSWLSMKARCRNKNHDHYAEYGGRGIRICRRWMWFKNFWADMGPRPNGMSLERIDFNGNYEPSNCKWATHTEQMRNTRRNKHHTISGVTKTVGEWARHYGVKYPTVIQRIKAGWGIERALTVKVGEVKTGPKRK